MTHISTAPAPADNDTFGGSDLNVLYLDPDIVALFAEIDAILCAALDPALCPPAPPVTGCPRRGPGRLAGRGVCLPAPAQDHCNPFGPSSAAPRPADDPRPR